MPSPHSSTYDVTKFHGSVPASHDIGKVINEIIADIKAHQTSQTAKPGGDILIPVGDYDLLTQVVIDISYLTIRGEGHGFTSLSIRDNTPDTSNWRETVAGGSHVKVKLTGTPAIVTRRNGVEPRLASLEFRDFCMDGLHFSGDGNSYINGKTGIYVEGDCDSFVVRGMGFVYLERALAMEGADATTVDGNFIAECGSCVELLQASQSCKVTNNLVGAGYNGKSIAATDMRRTKAEAAETRASILVAAEQMFFEKGVTATTLDDIASAANVTRGAIYWHFKSKTELFLELYDSVRLPELTMLDFQRAEEKGCDILSAIEAAAGDWLQLVATDSPRQRMLTILARTNFNDELETVATTIAAIDAKQLETAVAVFERAAMSGALHPRWSPECAGWMLKWLINGMCWEWLLRGQKFDLMEHGSKGIRTMIESFRK